jgi:hypothetical protein
MVRKKIIPLGAVAIIVIVTLFSGITSVEAREVSAVYHSIDQAYSILNNLKTSYSTQVSSEVIGKSILGKDILMYKIGNPNGGKFMFDGRIHGPEDCGTENGLAFVQWVLTSNESEAKSVLQNNYLLFIPGINVDTTRRQNMRRNYTLSNKTVIQVSDGVDLNRNFVNGWGDSGSTDSQNDYEFIGLYSASEPETQAVRNAMNKFKPKVYLNVHCGGGPILRYYSDSKTTQSVMDYITNISKKTGANTNNLYSPRQYQAGGYVFADGDTYTGGSSWLFEVSLWANLPDTLAEYKTNQYFQSFPIYLAMAKAVQTTTAICGNNLIESGEQCDGTNLGSKNTCNLINSIYTGGTPKCTNCKYDTTQCTNTPKSNLVNLAPKIDNLGGDYRNAYMIAWDGDACDNLAYAKNMGYDYVMYQDKMEECSNSINMHFYYSSPEEILPVARIYPNKTYTTQEKSEFQSVLLWKSNASFPTNLATGWFFPEGSFRPIADLQQQKVINNFTQNAIYTVASIEQPSKGFLFGGWAIDVPSLEGDLWSGLQNLPLMNRTGKGAQVNIDFWTGTCSGIKHANQDYSCYRDGKAAYYKTLFAETERIYSKSKVMMEPYSPWNDYLSEISKRGDKASLIPDFLCEEDESLEFVNDSRLFGPGLMTKGNMCSSTPDAFDHQTNLLIAGNAAMNGAWFNWFGRLGGTGNFPPYESITNIPDRLKLIRAVPGWDNLNGISLSQRSWDGLNLKYSSPNSYADKNLIYSTHPKNNKIYFVILNNNVGMPLFGKDVNTIRRVTNLFAESTDATADFTNDGTKIYLKSNSNVGKGYIITLKAKGTPTNNPPEPTEPVITPPKSGGGGGGGGSGSLTLYCGNSICANYENCSACPEDCGECPSEPVTSAISNPVVVETVKVPKSQPPEQISGPTQVQDSSFAKKTQPVSTPENDALDSLNQVLSTSTGLATKEVPSQSLFSLTSLIFMIAVIVCVFVLLAFRKADNKFSRKISRRVERVNNKVATFTQLLMFYPEYAKLLSDYVYMAIQAGHHEEIIKQSLVERGWPQSVVDSYLQRQHEAWEIVAPPHHINLNSSSY